MGLDFIIAHTGIWLNIWVFLAILALIVVIVYFIVRRRKLVKMEEELEDLLSDKYEREAADNEGENSVENNE